MVRLTVLSILCLALAACGAPDDPDNQPPPGGADEVTKTGYVSLAQTSVQGQTTYSGNGTFLGFQEPRKLPTSGNFFPNDVCYVSAGSDTGGGTTDPNPPTFLDAGDALTLRANGTPYATLTKEDMDDGTVLYASGPTTSLPPFNAGLTLDVPGAADGFPAFSGVAFPVPPADFTLTAPADPYVVTLDTVFTWSGADPSETGMRLAGTGQGAGDQAVNFTCFAVDDGSFSFPSTTRGELEGFGFTTGFLDTASRVNYASQQRGDVGLVLSALNTQLFPASP